MKNKKKLDNIFWINSACFTRLRKCETKSRRRVNNFFWLNTQCAKMNNFNFSEILTNNKYVQQ